MTKWEDPKGKKSKKCNAIFVCGIDTHIAKEFIQEHYKGIGENFAINYFRKIFNLTISMPRSPKIKSLLLKHIKDLYDWEDPNGQNAESLAKMIIVQGRHTRIQSVRKYLNVISNFYIFLKFNSEYSFTPNQDFVITLLMLKEVWQSLYEKLINEAIRERSNMKTLVQNLIDQEELLTEKKRFLSDFLGKDTPFAEEYLSDWLDKYPTLA